MASADQSWSLLRVEVEHCLVEQLPSAEVRRAADSPAACAQRQGDTETLARDKEVVV
jgi:hypothetical protein